MTQIVIYTKSKFDVLFAFLKGANCVLGVFFIIFALNHPYQNDFQLVQILSGLFHILWQIISILYMLINKANKVYQITILETVSDILLFCIPYLIQWYVLNVSIIEMETCIILISTMIIIWGSSIFFMPSSKKQEKQEKQQNTVSAA